MLTLNPNALELARKTFADAMAREPMPLLAAGEFFASGEWPIDQAIKTYLAATDAKIHVAEVEAAKTTLHRRGAISPDGYIGGAILTVQQSLKCSYGLALAIVEHLERTDFVSPEDPRGQRRLIVETEKVG